MEYQTGRVQAMQYGYLANVHDPTQTRDYAATIAEVGELVLICDRAGFATFWLPEHHLSVGVGSCLAIR
jgi:alkanesulfonate monooxygenase SsuD/methylene tetrahydromethanopterin reductase-like flavin-dependent oxidoreductase (luciferase family)